MPTYEYKCKACGHEFETMQGMNDPKIKACPSCGKRKLKRLIGSGGGVIFKKGVGGFHSCDYPKKRR